MDSYGTIKVDPPDYLENDLIDEDVKEVFRDKTHYSRHEILLLQLIKELKRKL